MVAERAQQISATRPVPPDGANHPIPWSMVQVGNHWAALSLITTLLAVPGP